MAPKVATVRSAGDLDPDSGRLDHDLGLDGGRTRPKEPSMPTLPIPVFAALILAFAGLHLWRAQQRVSPLLLLLCLCAAQSLIIALAQHYLVPGLRWVQPVTATLIPPLAWFACQVTAVRNAQTSDLLHGFVPLTALSVVLIAPQYLDILLPGVFVVYGVAILIQSLRGADAQPRMPLSSDNVPGRVWLLIGAALIASAFSDVLIYFAQLARYGHLQPWIITVFSVGNLLIIGMLSVSPYLRTDEEPQPETSLDDIQPDSEIWERVTAYMAKERPYLDPNLTLAQLSRKLRVPAKALSTTINRATGQNVSRFVNDARIRAAQTALLDGQSVTNAMFESGFNTKSNFNREFLRVAGTSPSEWRKSQESQ